MIVLDTNVISELMKKPADPAVATWFLAHENQIVLPTPAIGEIAFGIARLPHGARRRDLEAKLTDWRIRYADLTLSFTAASAMTYGTVMAAALKSGHNMTVVDAQIAAVALEHGYKLATRNIKDFETTDLKLINPWTA